MTDQTNPANKSAAGLLSDAIAHMSSLVRKEVDLARAEVSENVSRAGVAVGLLAGALVIALTALNVLAAALVAALAETDLGPGWSALIVGLVLAAIALVLALRAKNDLKLSSIAPTRAAKNVQRDAQAIKEVTTNGHD
jgi:protein-S-isoprenylcysteine O-methyltransferase Ste14